MSEDRWLNLEGLRVHYLAAGEKGPPVVLLHGGSVDCARLSWGQAMGPLAQRFRVYAPDWPGYGQSDEPKIQYTTQYFVGFLGRLLDALSLERVSLVGLSMGGAISLSFALQFPGRVEKLVLVNSYGFQDKAPWHKLSYILTRLSFLSEPLLRLLVKSRTLVQWSLRWVASNPEAISEELLNEIYEQARKEGIRKAFACWARSELFWDGVHTNLTDQLSLLNVPTLIVHGGRDRIVPVCYARRAHERIKDSRLYVFSDGGHWTPREKPEEFNQLIMQFLADC